MAASEPLASTFGRYRLLGRLGAGGMAEVYRAELVTSAGITKPVVIKKIIKAYADDEGFKAMFLEEARIAASLTHSNIAQVIDVGEIEGELYLALELIHGRSLSELLARLGKQGLRLPEEYACLVASEMCKGLHYAHTRTDAQKRSLNLVHRDISPQNVMLSFEGEVKLVDFGIAKAYGEDRPGRNKTATGVVKGKYHYFSPEQARSRPLDGRTDIYATGVVLYEMLCGKNAFTGPMTEVLRRIVHGDIPHPRALDPHISDEAERITLKAMAADLEGRYATAQSLQHDLAAHVARSAPGLGPAALAEVMAVTFDDVLASEGEGPVSEALRIQVGSWPKSIVETPSSSGQTRAARAPRPPSSAQADHRANPGTASAVARSRQTKLLLLAALAALTVGGLAALAWLRTPPPSAPTQVVVALQAAHTLPTSAAKKPAAPAVYRPHFGGRAIPGLGCDALVQGDSAQQAVKSYRAARLQGDAESEIVGAKAAVTNSPLSGAAYTLLVNAVIDQNRSDLKAARDLESFALSCPAKQSDIQLALDVAGRGAGAFALPVLAAMEHATEELVNDRDPEAAARSLDAVRSHGAGDVGFDALDARVSEELANHRLIEAAKKGDLADVRALANVPTTSMFSAEAEVLLARHHIHIHRAAPADVARAAELFHEGDVQSRLGDATHAIDLYKDAVAHDPTCANYLKTLGTKLVEQLRFDEAIPYYRRFLKLAPNDPQAPSIRVAMVQYEKLLKYKH